MLNGKLHILHISVVLLQSAAHLCKLLKCLRELLLHLVDVHRCTNTGYYVFSLCIGQELTEKSLVSGCRISCESHTGSAIVTHVTECHGLYVYGCTPRIGDVVVSTINICTGVIPAAEYGLDGTEKLFLRISREILTDLLLVFRLELLGKLVKVFCGKLNVLLNALLLLHLIDKFLEVLLSNFHNNVGVHLDKSSVAVPSPSGISGLLCDNSYYIFIQTKV